VEGDTTVDQLALCADDANGVLPPFRSAKDFPIAPKREKLSIFYQTCRQALVEANSARSLLKQRMSKKKDVIAIIRGEIEKLEQDLALEANTRLQLHAMNEQLLGALREMELMAEDVSTTIAEAHGGRRTGLKALVEKLKALVRNWRLFKQNKRAAIAKNLLERHDDETSS
jgi:hypothetical protein